MTKKKKKESWKEKRRKTTLKHQKAAEAERLRREREPKKSKGWSRSKILGIVFFASLVLVVGAYAAWRNTQPPNESGLASLYMLTDSDFSEFRGKVVVVDCFATWCQPCLQEIPHLAQIHEKYNSSEVVVISVGSSGDSAIELRQFKQDHDMTWRVARDTVGVFDKYNVQYIPTLVILSQSGTIHFQESNVVDASTLSSEIDALLGG
ncbi:TlpA family protein disulfide reductase [Candidatus Bathyarchaeota archaeon]|nr:TlpA family protein disulfide reductase [Candidatus Bathyarchaeota archaeon]